MLNKAIEHGKEKRKPYRGSKSFDCSCRNHGACDWCRENRLYSAIKAYMSVMDKLNEWEGEDGDDE